MILYFLVRLVTGINVFNKIIWASYYFSVIFFLLWTVFIDVISVEIFVLMSRSFKEFSIGRSINNLVFLENVETNLSSHLRVSRLSDSLLLRSFVGLERRRFYQLSQQHPLKLLPSPWIPIAMHYLEKHWIFI